MTARAVWAGGWLPVLGALAGCAGDDTGCGERDTAGFSERDSAGVRIVTSPGSALDTALPLVVGTAPDLALGAERESAVQVHDIRGIAALPDGGLVVLDGGSRELRWFDRNGHSVGTLGGRGAGPGEFLDPILVPRFQPDSLLIFDQRRRAFTLVALGGGGHQTLVPGGIATEADTAT